MEKITLKDEQGVAYEVEVSALKKVEDKKKAITFELKTFGGEVRFSSTTATTQREAILEAVASGAYLSGADLSGADLRDADLSGADLRDADLSDADLSGADLRDADLSDADLSGADLSGAYLSGAELCNAKFYGKGGTQKLKKSQLPDFLAALGFIIED